MNRTLWKEATAVLLVLITATILIARTDADLAISSRFFIDGAWPVGERFLWKALYRIDRIPALCLGIFGLVMFLRSLKHPDLIPWRRPGLFLVLLLALGPGLLVNTVFKEGWGRPRPREITRFGGEKRFLQPWQKGISGKGRSFPSGHSSAAFYLMTPYFIYRSSRKRRAYAWLAGGIGFGILMSVARITQGGHFLSDTLWAFGMVYLTAVILYYLLGLARENAAARQSVSSADVMIHRESQ